MTMNNKMIWLVEQDERRIKAKSAARRACLATGTVYREPLEGVSTFVSDAMGTEIRQWGKSLREEMQGRMKHGK